MSGKTRPGVLAFVWKNFVSSFKKRDTVGSVVGQDPFGNKYYEIPADPSLGKRRPKRWFAAPETLVRDFVDPNMYAGFDSTMPAEWESWLRHRRHEPPTEEEVIRSLALADLKKRNAAALEEKRVEELIREGRYVGPPKPQDHEKESFPKYDEYEITPGEEIRGDRWSNFKNPYSKETKKETKI